MNSLRSQPPTHPHAARRRPVEPLNSPVGDRNLCAWQPDRGITWVQTRSPHHARRLARRSDGRRVAIGVNGGYLRTFEFQHSLTWAIRLMARYAVSRQTSPNAARTSAVAPQPPPNQAPAQPQSSPPSTLP